MTRLAAPVFEPEAECQCSDFFGDVVLTCGLLQEDNHLKLYYGAADTTTCCAEIPLPDILANLGEETAV